MPANDISILNLCASIISHNRPISKSVENYNLLNKGYKFLNYRLYKLLRMYRFLQ